MVDVNKKRLEEKLYEIEQEKDLRKAKIFVQNFFGIINGQSLEQAYFNYLDDLIRYAKTNPAIRNNSTYFCYLFAEVTNTDTQRLAELEYIHHGAPTVTPLDIHEKSDGEYPTLEDIFGPVISSFSAEDAVKDGVFMKVGRLGFIIFYLTSNLYNEGYEDSEKLEELLRKGIEMLAVNDNEDTNTMKLRVIQKNKIWVTLTGDGITFMKPGDY